MVGQMQDRGDINCVQGFKMKPGQEFQKLTISENQPLEEITQEIPEISSQILHSVLSGTFILFSFSKI